MASIEKIKTTKGEQRYRVRWWLNGRRVEKWARTLVEAKTVKTQAEADALNGVAINPRAGAKQLNVYFDEWVEARLVKGKPLAASTRVGYERLWKRTIEPTIGRAQLRSVRPEAVRKWHGQVAASAGKDQAAKAYRLLRAVMGTAEADELIRLNPCRIRGAGQEHAAERPMVATSLVLKLADTIEPRYRALVLLAGFAGLRTGENLGLRRCDIDLKRGEVRVVVQAQEVKGAGRTELGPKSEAGRRVVALPRVAVEALEDHLTTFTGPDTAAPVFTGPEGTPLRRATLSKAWQAATAAVGAPDGLRPHDLRHHAATLTARMPGVTTKELMARIGHASPRAALIYQHATAERDRAVASFLDEQVAAAADEAKSEGLADVIDITTRGVGGGLASASDAEKADFVPETMEAATGIEPVYRALQALA